MGGQAVRIGRYEREVCRRALRSLGWGPARVVVARSPLRRLLGMVTQRPGRQGGASLVMAFFRCASVHTCFMRRPLDIAFLRSDGMPLAVYEHVRPWRVRSCRGAAVVLERFSRGRMAP